MKHEWELPDLGRPVSGGLSNGTRPSGSNGRPSLPAEEGAMWAEAWRGLRTRRHPRASKHLLGGISLAFAKEARCRQGSLSCDAPRGQPASWLEVRGANHCSALRTRE